MTPGRPNNEQIFARTEEQILAAVAAGYDMDGAPLTDGDRAAIRRIARGETTANQEVATLLAAIRARRTS
ncbi:hypothetical protein [Williamsia muralis]|uniref:Antitoxin VbhA domain-containing protein n=1 Tax=Williamsia marianensis TaxID=85044 RepID=A0ABU4EZM3_WILMA|nr:hypothetical protein [Williamsia muralis]MDV7136703.1 hypothetical protein [Williamsia muralis]